MMKIKKVQRLLEKYDSKFYTPEEKKAFIEELIKEVSPYLEGIVSRYVRKYPSIDKEDLLQEARLAVIAATNKFDLEKKTNFLSYLFHWVRVYIERYIAKNLSILSVPLNLVHVYSNRNKSKSEEEFLKKYRLSVRYLDRLKEYEQIRVYSLALDTNNNGEQANEVLNVPAPDSYSPEEVCSRLEALEFISDLCLKFSSTLNEKERHVFYECIYTDNPKSVDEIRKEYGVTRERIYQIKREVIKKFREFFYQNVPDADEYRAFV